MQAKLTGREEQALAVKPTNNSEAYDAYLRGLAFEARHHVSFSCDLLWKAAGFYERAVQLDPNFAIAWARLSRADADLYFNRVDAATAARGDAAKRALENAQKLEPNSPETLLALGYYQYWVLRDYGDAITTFERVTKMLPGNSEVPIRPRVGYPARGTLGSKHCLLGASPRPGSTQYGVTHGSSIDLHHASTIPRRAQARRSSAGHYAKRSRCDGVKGQHLSGTG